MTKEERHLWYDFLKHHPARFQRQKTIGSYIADFYCHEAKLVIELDGSQHYRNKNLQKDQTRTDYFEKMGLKVLRIPNNWIHRRFAEICAYIDEAVRTSADK